MYEKKPLRDRLASALAYQMRHKNDEGITEVLNVEKLQKEAGGINGLRRILLEICNKELEKRNTQASGKTARWDKWKEKIKQP